MIPMFYNFILPIGLLSAFLTLFLNYCIGKPGSEFSPYEIFSGYTVWLSKMRLSKMNLYFEYIDQYNENYKRLTTESERATLKIDFDKMLYNAAEPFFTWERALGVCSICTGVWISLIIGLIFTFNFSEIIEIIITSHITIRLLSRVI